jgi:hypothetical protein
MTRHANVDWHKRNFIRKNGPETRLSEDPGEYGRLGRDYRHARKAEWEEKT